MIIVSQNKDKIVNFDNVELLFIPALTEYINKKYEISCGNINGSRKSLGFYKTEERAKEVLKAIITCCAGDYVYYEMPEE